MTQLQSKDETGYREGQPFPIKLYFVGYNQSGETWLPRPLFDVYHKLHFAAKKLGYDVTLSSGFRTMAEQQKQWARRLGPDGQPDPKKVAQLGPAARPGYSKHQTGEALDLAIPGPNVQAWVEREAPKLGLHKPDPKEPWHWELKTIPKSEGVGEFLLWAGLAFLGVQLQLLKRK